MKEKFFPDGYTGSTRAELDHQLGNKITLVRLALDEKWTTVDDLPTMVRESQASFISGLQRAIDEQFPVFGGVTHDQLTEVVQLAERINWSSRDELQQLIDACHELREPIGG